MSKWAILYEAKLQAARDEIERLREDKDKEINRLRRNWAQLIAWNKAQHKFWHDKPRPNTIGTDPDHEYVTGIADGHEDMINDVLEQMDLIKARSKREA